MGVGKRPTIGGLQFAAKWRKSPPDFRLLPGRGEASIQLHDWCMRARWVQCVPISNSQYYCMIQNAFFWFHNTLHCVIVSQPTVHLHFTYLPVSYGQKGSERGRFDTLNIKSQTVVTSHYVYYHFIYTIFCAISSTPISSTSISSK